MNTVETYAFHVKNPIKLSGMYISRSTNPKFYSPAPKCRYEARRQNLVWCSVDEFLCMKAPGYFMNSVEEVVARFAAEIWCDGYVPEQVELSVAERYHIQCKFVSFFLSLYIACSAIFTPHFITVSTYAAVTAKVCEDKTNVTEIGKGHLPFLFAKMKLVTDNTF